MTDEALLQFIGAHINSVWAVEQMLLLAREPARSWEVGELVRETRSSPTVVAEALRCLKDVGLVRQTPDGKYCFAPKTNDLRAKAQEVLKAYVERPRFVIQAIFTERRDT